MGTRSIASLFRNGGGMGRSRQDTARLMRSDGEWKWARMVQRRGFSTPGIDTVSRWCNSRVNVVNVSFASPVIAGPIESDC